jgi:hypothetical protein
MRSIFMGTSIFDGDFGTRLAQPARSIRGFKPPSGGFPVPWEPAYEEEERRRQMAALQVRRSGPWGR